MSEAQETKSSPLPPALLEAQRAVKDARKTSTNAFHGYKYASAEEVICVARDALNDAGLTFGFSSAAFERFASDLGKAVGVLHLAYQLEHSSGAVRVVTSDIAVVLEKGRDLDKAIFAARTESLGYALRDLLLIPRSDAPDVSGRDDREPARQERRPEPAPRSASNEIRPPAPVWAEVLSNAIGRVASAADNGVLVKALVDGRREVHQNDVQELDMSFARQVASWMGVATTEQDMVAISAAVNQANMNGKFAETPWKLMIEAKTAAKRRIGAPA